MGSQICALYIPLDLYFNNSDSQSHDRQIYRNECCTLLVDEFCELRQIIFSALHDNHQLVAPIEFPGFDKWSKKLCSHLFK